MIVYAALAFVAGWLTSITFLWVLFNVVDVSGDYVGLFVARRRQIEGEEEEEGESETSRHMRSLLKENSDLLRGIESQLHALEAAAAAMPKATVAVRHMSDVSGDAQPEGQREIEQEEVEESAVAEPVKQIRKPKKLKEGEIHVRSSGAWLKVSAHLHSDKRITLRHQDSAEVLGVVRLEGCDVRLKENVKNCLEMRHQEDMPIYGFVEGSADPKFAAHHKGHAHCLWRFKSAEMVQEWKGALDSCCLGLDDDLIDEEEGEDAPFSDGGFSDEEVEELILEEVVEEAPTLSYEARATGDNVMEAARNPREKKALTMMIKVLGDKYDRDNHSGYMLLRFLRARGLDPVKAVEMMNNRLAWARDFKPDQIQLDDIRSEIPIKKAFFHCFDRKNQPCILVFAARHDPKTSDLGKGIKLLVHLLETAIASMPPGVEKFSAIFDCTGFSVNQMDWPFVKEGINTLQNMYPERLGNLFIVNYPWVINMLWKVIKPWLDARTREKIQFVDNPKRNLSQFFDKKFLVQRYGGKSTYEKEVDVELGIETLEDGYVPPQAS